MVNIFMHVFDWLCLNIVSSFSYIMRDHINMCSKIPVILVCVHSFICMCVVVCVLCCVYVV